MQWYSIEPRTRKFVTRYEFLLFARKFIKKGLDTELDAVKTAFKKVVHKSGEFSGNEIADAVTKLNDDNIDKQKLVEEIIILKYEIFV